MKILETDKRVRKTKLAFREALKELLSQKDIRNITVKELCALADVNRGTFYSHYHEVNDIIEEMQDEMEASLLELLQNTETAIDKREAIINNLYHVMIHIASNKNMCSVMLRKKPDEDFQVRISRIASKHLAESYHTQTKEDKLLTDNLYCFILGGCMGLLRKWVQNGMKESPEEISDLALRLIRHTLHPIS